MDYNKSNIAVITLRNKVIALSRFVLVRYFPNIIPFYMITEFPKSGGTWLGQLLSSYFDIPFPRNTFPKFRKSIVHGHFLPAKSSGDIKKIFFLVRDGRD
ncbi:MAG: hypothetical protein ABFR75_13765, partial [Acidobacteriota bacterium]